MNLDYSWLKLRAGYAFESQAAPADQPGVTNLLDGKQAARRGGALKVYRDRLRSRVPGAPPRTSTDARAG